MDYFRSLRRLLVNESTISYGSSHFSDKRLDELLTGYAASYECGGGGGGGFFLE
jgi:hypothetical protein